MCRFIAALILAVMVFSAADAPAEELPDEEILEEVLPDSDAPAENGQYRVGEAADFLLGVVPEASEITPACRSEEHPEHGEGCFWCTPMDLENEEAIWKMLTAPITVVQAKENAKALDDQMRQTFVYAEPDEKSKKIGMVTGQSQGLPVLESRDGWTKVET